MTQSSQNNKSQSEKEKSQSPLETIGNIRRRIFLIGFVVLAILGVLAVLITTDEQAPTPQQLQPGFDEYYIIDDNTFVLDFIDDIGTTFGVLSEPVGELVDSADAFLMCLAEKDGFDLRAYITEGAQGDDNQATLSEALLADQRAITAVIDWNRTSAGAFDCALGERSFLEIVTGALATGGEEEIRFCVNSVGFEQTVSSTHQYTFGYIGIGQTICNQLDDYAASLSRDASAAEG